MGGTSGDRLLPAMPPNVPRVKPNTLARWFGRTVLRLGGWRMQGELPDIPRMVVIGAPHSSNWDGVWAFSAKMALGLDLKVLGKQELFWWPMGYFLRRLGVIAVDRRSARGVVEQVADRIRNAPDGKFWFGIAPEGTRSRVERWKPGFWKIAKAAGVPVLPMYFHYGKKIIGVAQPVELSDDMHADIQQIHDWYRTVSSGRNRDV